MLKIITINSCTECKFKERNMCLSHLHTRWKSLKKKRLILMNHTNSEINKWNPINKWILATLILKIIRIRMKMKILFSLLSISIVLFVILNSLWDVNIANNATIASPHMTTTAHGLETALAKEIKYILSHSCIFSLCRL